MSILAIIAAAGQGSRMESAARKQYMYLEGIPVLARSLNLFLEQRRVDEIVAVIPPGDREEVLALLQPYCSGAEIRLIEGGATRQESVSRGLKASSVQADLVCIHDAARPLASPALLEALLDAAESFGAAVPVIPLSDTVKEVDRQGNIISTPVRESLRLVQTPQVFRREIITEAYRYAGKHNLTATDDASLVEALGRPVKTVSGEQFNLKITSLRDLMLASLFLKGTAVK